MKYTLWIDNQAAGPSDVCQLTEMFLNGTITRDTKMRLDNADNTEPWTMLGDTFPSIAALPTRSATMQILFAEIRSKNVPLSPLRVTAHLSLIRANTSYGILRYCIEISFVLSVLAAICFTISFTTFSLNASSIVVLLVGILVIILLVAARQSALLIIDIADTLLHDHSKSRNA